MRKRVYISGPLTSSGDPQENMRLAGEAHLSLMRLGFAPLCPHLTLILDPNAELPHADWLEVDEPWVVISDAVLRLPGDSKGADFECRVAAERNIPVFHSVGDLLTWSRVC